MSKELREEVIKAYIFLRENNNTIPDSTLEFIKNSALLAEEQAKCNHILGKAFELNPEEGPAWLHVYQKADKYEKDFSDWIIYYPHCPSCGARNIELSKEISRLESV